MQDEHAAELPPEAATVIWREPKAGRGGVQSVDRALLLLELLADAGGAAPLGLLSARSGLNVSTCHHLLATMANRGYVAKVKGKRTYAIGARILHLSQAFKGHASLAERADPFLDQVNARTGETVHLAIFQGDSLTTIAKREALHAVRVDVGTIGKSDAAHATATGKAILASFREAEIRDVLTRRGMKRFTPNTVTDVEALLVELAEVRQRGHAIDHEEFQPGVICIGAPIHDHTGAVVASISASTPTMRASDAHLARIRGEVTAACRAVSLELGAPK